MLKFIKVERNAALIIVAAGLSGLLLANLIPNFSHQVEPIHHYAELALALFFFVIGLELKSELTIGVFKNRKALLTPALAALLGAVTPAGMYFMVTFADPVARSGWAIPMATDITFALAVFAIFGSKMPNGSKQFLLAFSIIDDLLAILVILLFLKGDVLTSVIITGSALVGVAIPSSWTHKLQELITPINNALVLPVFAFVSLSIHFDTTLAAVLGSVVGIGVLLRVIGKTLGITIGAYLGSRFTKENALPFNVYARLSILGGIGFTVAFLVNDIVFENYREFHVQAVIGSLVAAVLSVSIAAFTLRKAR